MIKKLYHLFFLLLFAQAEVLSQVINITSMDTLEATQSGHVVIGGYVDTYFGYNFSNREDSSIPYYVSSARNNQFQINLAYLQLHFRSKGMRARFTPGVGTYMNDNYTNEPGTLKNIVEANVGVLISEKRKIWLDAGVFTSHYTNESAISKDQLMYSRSLGSENSPYYLAGAKLSFPINQNVNAYFFLLNGWQVIEDNNKGKSIGTQIEYQPKSSMLFNWNTYIGDERSDIHPDYRTRFFTDLFWVYQPNEKFSATSCIYIGAQILSNKIIRSWWQVNVTGRYNFTDTWSLTGRFEYFTDPDLVLLIPVTSVNSFRAFSTGIGTNYKVHSNALLRMEVKKLFSPDELFLNSDNEEVKGNLVGMVSLNAWF